MLVIQPVKKITIDAGAKKVAAGGTLQLSASYTPENASITGVTGLSDIARWSLGFVTMLSG